MGPTIYASFESREAAQAAIGELIRTGVPADDISLSCRTGKTAKSVDSFSAELNPAQDDYPRTGSTSSTELSSTPPAAPRDYNAGLEADNYNENYRAGADRDMEKDLDVERARLGNPGGSADGVGPTTNEDYRDLGTSPRGREPSNIVNPDRQQFGAMPGVFPDLRAPGFGTTQQHDSAMGAIGTETASIAATAGASANPGGMTDFLWNSLPVDFAEFYQREYDGGKAVLIVRSSNEGIAQSAEGVLQKHGAQSVERHGYMS